MNRALPGSTESSTTILRWPSAAVIRAACCHAQGVSFKVPAGTSCAIVGTSGSGKSTVLRLLFRFYDVQTGSVAVGGHDVRDLTLASLRRQIGQVPQDLVLFNDTIFYNILYGRLGAAPEDVFYAARRAAIDSQVLGNILSPFEYTRCHD